MQYFKERGLLLDVSRKGVMKVSQVKRYIDLMKRLDYNALLFYTEDVYEVDGHPYFGYMRGRYTGEQLKELDAYARENGIELIPCIQTLAHIGQIGRWKPYADIFDCGDILLVDEPKTYQLLDDLFAALRKYYSSSRLHIGMDEAHMLGLGRYLDKHGYVNRFELFCKHLTKVAEIAQKYGFTCMMWSDMFYKLLNNGEYYAKDLDVPENFEEMIPKNVELVYWDYWRTSEEHYRNMLKINKKFGRKSVFGGNGGTTFTGFVPANAYSIEVTHAATKACIEEKTESVFLTLWGDDGKECPYFAVVPTLYAFSQFSKGNFDMESIKSGFEKEFDIPFDDFLALDLPNKVDEQEAPIWNDPHRYSFYNDLFVGIFDSFVRQGGKELFESYATRLKKHCANKEYGYIFRQAQALCEVLAIKYDLGVRTRGAYQAGDKATLKNLAENEYTVLLEKIENFYRAFLEYWNTENTPYGFEVHDARLGGLKRRVEHCRERLLEFVDGKTESIPELNEKVLDYLGEGEVPSKEQTKAPFWSMTFVH